MWRLCMYVRMTLWPWLGCDQTCRSSMTPMLSSFTPYQWCWPTTKTQVGEQITYFVLPAYQTLVNQYISRACANCFGILLQDEDRSEWQLLRRFFKVDRISGITATLDGTEYIIMHPSNVQCLSWWYEAARLPLMLPVRLYKLQHLQILGLKVLLPLW